MSSYSSFVFFFEILRKSIRKFTYFIFTIKLGIHEDFQLYILINVAILMILYYGFSFGFICPILGHIDIPMKHRYYSLGNKIRNIQHCCYVNITFEEMPQGPCMLPFLLALVLFLVWKTT